MAPFESAHCENPQKSVGKPRIAVIVPAYGVAHLIPEALDSLLAQTLDDWECVVIDDGAPDNVAAAVAPYLADTRIRFVQTENHGVSAARNTAVSLTTAPLIALLDGDDLLRATYLERMVAALEADPLARIATCNARVFGAVPQESFAVSSKQGTGDGVRGSFADVLDRSFNIYIGSSFRRADFDAVQGFDENMAHSEDFDFWIRLMRLKGHALYIDEVLGDYRVRPGSASASGFKMLAGNLAAYEKALSADPGGPEAPLLARLIEEAARAVAFERAIELVIQGETRTGLQQLRQLSDRAKGLHWQLSFLAWRLFPPLARPMLTWRKQAHARGSDTKSPIDMFLGRKTA